MPAPAFARPDRRAGRRAGRRRLAIALTPLIDVVFILLIFFMLAAKFVDHRSLRLAATATESGAGAAQDAVRAETARTHEGALLVEALPQDYRFAGRTMDAAALSARLASTLARAPRTRVLLRPAQGASVQRLVAALDLLTAVGAADVALMEGR
jgi:biopolymer transport protein ExbD